MKHTVLLALHDPSNVGTPWPVNVSTESASVGIPGAVSISTPEPVSMVSVRVPETISVDAARPVSAASPGQAG